MKRYRLFAGLLSLMMAVLGCTACGNTTQKVVGQSGTVVTVTGMETTPVINYTLPVMNPNILVNGNGYAQSSDKEIAVRGKELPNRYRLLDAETDEIVHSGAIEEIVYHEEQQMYAGLIVLTDFKQAGSFYLECDMIGQSVPFTIEEDCYGRLFTENYDVLMQAFYDNTIELSQIVTVMTAYEWYPGIFPDADLDQIPDVMEAVGSWIMTVEKTKEDQEHSSLYVAALAKFSYLYQKYDLAYATECLQHASAVFAMQKTPTGRNADYFYALTELYRATGLSTYRNQILDFKSYFEGNTSYLTEVSYLYGAMTYLVTRQSVDVGLCDIFMSDIMDGGEEISQRYRDMIHPITAKNNGADDLLSRAGELSCCNYILNNYQYTHIIEEFLHYLMGSNLESKCFYPEEGDRSKYLLLLAQLTATAQ